jgi:hypothetical protein
MASFSTMRRFVPLLWFVLVLSACSLFGPSGPPYLVYFQERSAQLDAPARSVIALAALRAKTAGSRGNIAASSDLRPNSRDYDRRVLQNASGGARG